MKHIRLKKAAYCYQIVTRLAPFLLLRFIILMINDGPINQNQCD